MVTFNEPCEPNQDGYWRWIDRVHLVSMLLSITMTYWYRPEEFVFLKVILTQWGVTGCAAQWVLYPTPYLLAGFFLWLCFFYLASNYRPKKTDWSQFVCYLNRERELEDLFSGKLIRKKDRLALLKLGVPILTILMLYIFWHVHKLYAICGQKNIVSDLSIFEGFVIIALPVYTYWLLSIFVLREEKAH